MDIDRKVLLQAITEAIAKDGNESAYLKDMAQAVEYRRAVNIDSWLVLDAIWIALKTEWKPS